MSSPLTSNMGARARIDQPKLPSALDITARPWINVGLILSLSSSIIEAPNFAVLGWAKRRPCRLPITTNRASVCFAKVRLSGCR